MSANAEENVPAKLNKSHVDLLQSIPDSWILRLVMKYYCSILPNLHIVLASSGLLEIKRLF